MLDMTFKNQFWPKINGFYALTIGHHPNWSITRLSTMTFHLNECTVQHGTTIITIVNGGCYAEALAVVPNATKQGFNFKTFKGAGETDPDQMIKCKLNICEVGQCTNPIADSQCPATGDEKYYGYRI